MNGILTGGWSFVWAAYSVTATILAAYSIHTILEFRRNASKKAASSPQ